MNGDQKDRRSAPEKRTRSLAPGMSPAFRILSNAPKRKGRPALATLSELLRGLGDNSVTRYEILAPETALYGEDLGSGVLVFNLPRR